MSYDPYLADRITRVMQERNANFFSKKMMGGLVFMVNDKMCVGIHIDKKLQESLLMARIGIEAYEKEIHKTECLPMDFTGRPMKGYIFIKEEGIDMESDLEYWIDLALRFNKTLIQSN